MSWTWVYRWWWSNWTTWTLYSNIVNAYKGINHTMSSIITVLVVSKLWKRFQDCLADCAAKLLSDVWESSKRRNQHLCPSWKQSKRYWDKKRQMQGGREMIIPKYHEKLLLWVLTHPTVCWQNFLVHQAAVITGITWWLDHCHTYMHSEFSCTV